MLAKITGTALEHVTCRRGIRFHHADQAGGRRGRRRARGRTGRAHHCDLELGLGGAAVIAAAAVGAGRKLRRRRAPQ